MTKIFVFGSNLAGRHGRGAALTALKQWGAEYGVGRGRTGMAYALPTKDRALAPLSLRQIKYNVDEFIAYAMSELDLTFIVTKVGCGLAGYSEDDIAPMFARAPENCQLPEGWRAT